MVESIARQSVIIKCNLSASIMTGNYEFYYAAGLLYKLNGVAVEEVPEPAVLEEQIQQMLGGFEPADDKQKHLVKLLRFYKPTEAFDEQMKDLFRIGNKEQYMWQELVPQS